MSTLLRITLGAFAIALHSHPQTAAAQGRETVLTGQWRGETSAIGATASTTINFFANGTYARRVVVVMRYGWTLDGNMLLLAPETVNAKNELDYGPPSVAQLAIYGDTLVAKFGGESLTLRRVTVPIDESPLAGRWEGKTDAGNITQDFTSDGKLMVTITLSRSAGRYAVNGNTITWEEQIPIPERRRSKFKIDNEKLILDMNTPVPLQLTRTASDTPRS